MNKILYTAKVQQIILMYFDLLKPEMEPRKIFVFSGPRESKNSYGKYADQNRKKHSKSFENYY